MKINSDLKVTDIFLQDGQLDVGIPDHWCVQYYTRDSVFCQYEYCSTYEECLLWCKDNCLEENMYV